MQTGALIFATLATDVISQARKTETEPKMSVHILFGVT